MSKFILLLFGIFLFLGLIIDSDKAIKLKNKEINKLKATVNYYEAQHRRNFVKFNILNCE